MIEKLVPNDHGGFTSPDGCYWETKKDYLLIGVLPSCGCGDPESIGKYVKDMLLSHVHQTNSDDYSCWDRTKYDDLPVMFFLSWASREGYTEHGTSIRCSWMTDLGNQLLKDLAEVE